ncbi:MAG: hypothetical protein IKQ60_10980, partial [Candidatus Methanomethylophilaceae archaeon]|nr:hypothetical protein [Candidatus Methanomethylophilaceae archaeon]
VSVQSFMTVHTEGYESITIGIDLDRYGILPEDADMEPVGAVGRFVEQHKDRPLWPLRLPDRPMADVIAI